MEAFNIKIGIFDILPELQEKAKQLGYHIYNSIDELVQDAVIRNLELICHELQQTDLHFDNKYIDEIRFNVN